MPTSKTSLDFKLIAVRVLPGCVQHIRKCLVENHFYYLNNDYRISEDGKLITRRSSNIAPLSASFFSLSEKQSKGVRLNFSAIVGMNGDGKSSLVELIIRILNNTSIIHEIGEKGTLFWIQGVKAELYYHLDGIFYRLVTTEDDARIYRYVETGNVYKQDCIVGKEMLKKLFFYTMVSNYSLYAYNSLDIPNEWESKDNNQKDEEYCWLHRVFHKNDGYQTPLSLHPYRSYGNIDMNREKFLSMQRLLSLMVHPHPANPHSNPFRLLNDKKAELLELEDIGYSKLQNITIIGFFLKHRDTNLLQEDIAYLEEQDTLSSGEKQRYFSVGAIIYHLLNIDSIGSGKIHYQAVNLMLEEIELYFHPEWQRSFTCYLMEIIGQLTFKQIRSINVLYVTHSPYILSDIPKTNVLFLKNGEADYSMQENTFGANINGLLKNGFFLPSLPMGEFAHQKINDLFALLHSGDFKASELEKIRQEIQLVGEPVIRQQLMMLYNTYKRLNQELDDNAFRNFIIKKLEE